MRPLAHWRKEVSLHIHSLSAAVLVVMGAVYAVAFFQLPDARSWLKSLAGSREVFVYNLFASTAFIIATMTVKTGALWILGPKANRWKFVKQSFFAVSFYLVFIGSAAVSITLLSSRVQGILSSTYWDRSHWFWQALFIALALTFVGMVLHRYRLLTPEVLKDLRTIPIVSPLFCFAGPKYLLDNFEKFGIPQNNLKIHSLLLISAGLLFLASLVLQTLIRPPSESTETRAGLLASDGTAISSQEFDHNRTKHLVVASFCCLGLALLGFALAISDATLLLLK